MNLNNPFSRASHQPAEFHLNSEDFRILLDQINTAAVLIQLAERKVVAVNYRYTELSGYGTDELSHAGIERVLVDVALEKITDGSVQQLSLIRKNKNPIKTTVSAFIINQAEQLAILNIQEMEAEENKAGYLAVRLLNGLLEINKNVPGNSLEGLVQSIVRTGRDVFLAKTGAFYLFEKEQDKAPKIAGKDTLFPETDRDGNKTLEPGGYLGTGQAGFV